MTTILHSERLDAVLAAVRESRARTVLDLGCGDGSLLRRLALEPRIERIVGLDLDFAALDRLRVELSDRPQAVRARVDLVHGSITEAGPKLAGFDAAVLVETIEHLAPDRLSIIEHAIFRRMRPASVFVSTPNADFNPLLGVPSHRFRHPDHRFEWGRERFRTWAGGVARRNGYAVGFRDLAGAHPACGGASQMASFAQEVPRRCCGQQSDKA